MSPPSPPGLTPLKPPFSNIRDRHQSSGHPISPDDFSILSRGETRALIGGGGGGRIFIYSCSARRISFEINLNGN